MMGFSRLKRLSLPVALLLAAPAFAQHQRGKVGGLGGLTFSNDPERDFPRAGTLNGFIGVRFGDNLSLEAGFNFARVAREFTGGGPPVTDSTPIEEPRELVRRTDYGLDGTLVINLGRRSQLHPFLLGGAGIRRTEELTSLRPDALSPPASTESGVEYRPTLHFGAGMDLYFMYNVAGRIEARYYFPDFKNEQRQLRLLFGGTFFF
jgi:hypothetical protein